MDAAKDEARGLKDTAAAETGHVVDTAKDEASAVLSEAKSQAKDLYAQTQRELKDQAQVQQERVASGLRAVGEELDSMARSTENPGVAADLVGQLSTRLTGAATWLGDRDPGSLLAEVKSYARRKPGMFIAAAAVAGVVAGRLTRALAANASDDSGAAPAAAGVSTATPSRPATAPPPPMPTDADFGDTPVFAQSSAALAGDRPLDGDTDVRRDTL